MPSSDKAPAFDKARMDAAFDKFEAKVRRYLTQGLTPEEREEGLRFREELEKRTVRFRPEDGSAKIYPGYTWVRGEGPRPTSSASSPTAPPAERSADTPAQRDS